MLILHVIASGARRGGEVFASDLIRCLRRHEDLEQHLAVLHAPSPEALAVDGLPVRLLSSEASPGRFSHPILRSLRKSVQELRPDVIQAHGGEALKYLSLLSLADRTPLVYRRIGAAVSEVRTNLRRALFAAEMRRADRIVAVAEAVRAETVEVFGIAASKLVTIPNAVDASRLEAHAGGGAFRQTIGLNPETEVISFIGAFTWEKDPVANLRVALRVLERRPNAVFVMAGEGPLRPEVEIIVSQSRHRDRVKIVGARQDVGDILIASDLLISASRTEGMPANLIEAGMLGVPVVSFAMSGIPEIVLDHETGYLVAPGDLPGLESAVLRLLQQQEIRQRMSLAAQERCLATFDINKVAPRYMQVYEEVVHTRGSHRVAA